MAKNHKKKVKSKKTFAADNVSIEKKVLPQNIISVGERVLENKNIYISQSVYKTIHKFTKDKTQNESGGILVGYAVEEFGKINIIICGFFEAKYCESTPTTLKFKHETWQYWHKEIEKKYPDKQIVGWIHTHPDFGIFLSEYDKFIQNNYFSEENHVAYVIDPIRNEEGFYFWINRNLERCKGFYIFDKTGIKIDTLNNNYELETKIPQKTLSFFSYQNIFIFGLSALCLILSVMLFSLSARVSGIKKDFDKFQERVNNNFGQISKYMQSQINNGNQENNMTEPITAEEKTNTLNDKQTENKATTKTETTAS